MSGADQNFTALATPNMDKTTDLLLEKKATMLAFSPDGKRLAAVIGVNDDYQVHLFDVVAGKGTEKPSIAKAKNGISFNDASTLVCWDEETLHVFDVVSGQFKHELKFAKGHRSQKPHLALCPGKPLFATAGSDGDLLVKDLATGEIKQRIAVDADLTAVSFSPDGKHLLACMSKEVQPQRGTMQAVLSVKIWKVHD